MLTRRAATTILSAAVASALLPHGGAASGACPERGVFVRPLEDPIRRLLLIDLEQYSGNTPAVVYTHPELLPPQKLIGFKGRGFRFEPMQPGDPDAPYLWKIVPICRRPTV